MILTKSKSYELCPSAAVLFVIFVPVLSSLFDSNAILRLFCAILAFAIAHDSFKRGVMPVSKVSLFILAVTLYSFVSLVWVGDKGAQFSLSIVFLAAGLLGTAVKITIKNNPDKRILTQVKKAIYYSAVLYSFINILYQFFIAENILKYRMAFSSGSSFATAALMVVGIMCARSVRRGREKNAGFITALVMMIYVFLMTGSLFGYMLCAAISFAYTFRTKKHRVEAFVSCVALIVLSILKIVYTLMHLSLLQGHFSAALYGLSKVFGCGKGGYNAFFAILERSHETPLSTLFLMAEAWGVFGVAVAAVAVIYSIRLFASNPKISRFAAAAVLCGILFSSSEHVAFAVPILAAYFMAQAKSVNIRASFITTSMYALLGGIALYLAIARIPLAMGDLSYDVGDFETAAARYELGAEMELFSSEGWEKAYNAATENSKMKEYLENASKFNGENLEYSKKIAEIYSSEGNSLKALEIWDEIISECDSETLYPSYAEKILDAMALKMNDVDAESELYGKIELYAEKCENDETKRMVNDILARAQKYYVESREGGVSPGDMYSETPTEEASE